MPPVRRGPALVSAAGGAGPRAGTRRRFGAAAAGVRPCHQCVLHHRPAGANTRAVPRSACVSGLVRSGAGPRWRDPRAHHGGGGAGRRRHQPRVLLQLRRSVRVRLRHQAAAQRHLAARRDGRRAKRPADRPSMADGRDPRAHTTGDRRRRPSRIASGASCRATRTSNGWCETAGSGSPASMRSPAPCGSSGRRASSRTRPSMRLRSSRANLPRGIRANAGSFPRWRSCRGHQPRPVGRVAQAGPSA